MAYAAVVSLRQILEQLLHSDRFPVRYPKPQIEFVHGKVDSLQSSLERISGVSQRRRGEVDDLENKIRDAAYEAQDIIESFISGQILSSESEEIPEDQSSASGYSEDLQKIISIIDSIAETATKVADSNGHGKKDFRKLDFLSENASATESSYITETTMIVGQEEALKKLKAQLFSETRERKVVPVTGLPGIGKTTLARRIYDDPDIKNKGQFQLRAWVTVAEAYDYRDILVQLLSSIETVGQKGDASDSMGKMGDKASQESDIMLGVNLHRCLINNKYLIVIDDMWEKEVWNQVIDRFPKDKSGSRILLTTRNEAVARHANSSFHHVMEPLKDKDSWTLLCNRAIKDGSCPPHLEKIGFEIAKQCDGLPLLITLVGGILSQKGKAVEDWESVKADIHAALQNAETDEKRFSEILSLSYNHLPIILKGCFLYMGAFPEDSEILVSKLIKLWVAEGFLTPLSSTSQSLEQVARQCLKTLNDRNLISIRNNISDSEIKTCRIHDSLRALAVQKSGKEKFFYTRNRYVQELPESSDRLRRLSVHKNVLMCLQDVYNSTKSIKFARTLLYAGPHHHHPFPFRLTFGLLRVLDAYTMYFIEFPNEVVTLIHLRYLSFTYNRKIPPSLSKLRNLQILIVRRHPKIILLHASILPVEIWNMPQLRHLLFTESNLPDLSGLQVDANNSLLLENLQSLSNVHAACCTHKVLQNIRNLRKLGTWVEKPRAVHLHLGQLENLEAFKFTVLNPIPNPGKDSLPKLVFPEKLKKLSLSGSGFHWEDMEIIAELQNLQVLKLREFAFQGPTWDPNNQLTSDEAPSDDSISEETPNRIVFPKLKFLLLESLHVQEWLADDSNFPKLERLIIRHCYKLECILPEIADIGTLKLIQLVDCRPSLVRWAKDIEDEKKDMKTDFEVLIHSSWA
ncbi:putative late blight resistance proteinR1A-4 [Sesamum alatum]|uniref:Late blight resistance proteinR1A-4 n=1 Tax=Sesamum alatum TaxID=300844 RepID=A0AAE2CXV4_9LAMI|nr:putative late blight resistance proteinR1A-4 [Sesamum alatum]